MYKKIFDGTGLKVPEIMLPKKSVDYSKWAVVACDQYTSEPDYWEKVSHMTSQYPSTYKITLPEIYLNDSDVAQRIKNTNQTMAEYMNDGVLEDIGECFILTERTFTSGVTRIGLVVALDLECYDYSKDTESLIRPTEGTVEDRLPPRLRIRKDALLETPHILVLIDNPEMTVIEPLYTQKDRLEKCYDFELMLGGGHLKGYKISEQQAFEQIAKSMKALAMKEVQMQKYGQNGSSPFLYAMGDGNHSLATAKAHWSSIKKNLTLEEAENHPARYALVEMVNIHDPGIVFEPIHRVLFGISPERFIKDTLAYMEDCHPGSLFTDKKPEPAGEFHHIKIHGKNLNGYLNIKNPAYSLEYRTVQEYLDWYLKTNPSVKIDYIHGENTLKSLCENPDNTGLEMPSIGKFTLFKTVLQEGVLPRKSFSMGESYEKRYYMECRKITL